MNTHVSPEALSTQAENELICEKLLGWERFPDPKRPAFQWRKMFTPTSWEVLGTPTFTTWAEAGLILDAFERIHISDFPHSTKRSILFERDMTKHTSMPIAIRAAALEYLKAVKS